MPTSHRAIVLAVVGVAAACSTEAPPASDPRATPTVALLAPLGTAAIQWQAPKDGAIVSVAKGQKAKVVATYTASGVGNAEVHCYADNQWTSNGVGSACSFDLGPGGHVLAAVLAPTPKLEFGGKAATAVLWLSVSPPCAATADCADANPCSSEACVAGQCAYKAVADCCSADQQCAVADPCRKGYCIDNVCRSANDPAKPKCCSALGNLDCDDGNPCTTNKCEQVGADGAGVCSSGLAFDQPAGCCLYGAINANLSCDDKLPCTADYCDAYQCKHLQVVGCCQDPIDCDDGQACTLDLCVPFEGGFVGMCSYTKTSCCDAFDCNDGKGCTLDACTLAGACTHTALGPDCCDSNSECDDGQPCTLAACVNHACVAAFIADGKGCCQNNGDCDDGKVCTTDTCAVSGGCKHTAIADCCTDDAEANANCDDGNPCTIAYCIGLSCHQFKAKTGCCQSDADCNDTSACTVDKCQSMAGGKGTCSYKDFPGSCPKTACMPDNKSSWTYDKNDCSQEMCALVDGNWTIVKQWMIPNCCVDNADCEDGDPATLDVCLAQECVFFPWVGTR